MSILYAKSPQAFYSFAKDIYPSNFVPSRSHRFVRLLENKDKLLRNYSALLLNRSFQSPLNLTHNTSPEHRHSRAIGRRRTRPELPRFFRHGILYRLRLSLSRRTTRERVRKLPSSFPSPVPNRAVLSF
jgi:hypothetical protein